jgi:hypothetical protein
MRDFERLGFRRQTKTNCARNCNEIPRDKNSLWVERETVIGSRDVQGRKTLVFHRVSRPEKARLPAWKFHGFGAHHLLMR